jgi:hypothetical protein
MSSVKPNQTHGLTTHTLQRPLAGSSGLTLALFRGLFVEFATSYLGKDTCLFAGTFETPQCDFERLIFFDTNSWHRRIPTSLDKGSEKGADYRQINDQSQKSPGRLRHGPTGVGSHRKTSTVVAKTAKHSLPALDSPIKKNPNIRMVKALLK